MYYRDLEKLGFIIHIRFYSSNMAQGTTVDLAIEFNSNIFFKHSLRDIREERFKVLDTKIRDYFYSLSKEYVKYINSQNKQAYAFSTSKPTAYYSGITPELRDFVKEVHTIIMEDITNGYKDKL